MRKNLIWCFLAAYTVQAQSPAYDPNWEIVWQDHFTGTSINTSDWLVANHFDHYGGELQVYTDRPQNVSVSGGNLILKIDEENYSCPPGALTEWGCARQFETGLPYDYTSGWVETKQVKNTQYGYIEANIHVPYGSGLWPAFWAFVGPGVVGASGPNEIDIFEMLGNQPPTTMGTNLHPQYCNCELFPCITCVYGQQQCPTYDPTILCYGLDVTVPDYSTGFHRYAVEWSPDHIRWYFDDIMVREHYNPDINDPVRIILNVATPEWMPPGPTAVFPKSMLVDYVKVYKLRRDCINQNICGSNFTSYDNKVKNLITVGDGTCGNTLLTGQSIFLRATEGTLINGDFNAPVGSEMYIEAKECY